MVVDNDLTGGVDQRQYALKSPDTGRIVIFAEETDSITLLLGNFSNPFEAILVDAEAAYAEIDLGVIEPSTAAIDLSGRGEARDWALSLTPIPEPGSCKLALLASIAFLLNRRKSASATSAPLRWKSHRRGAAGAEFPFLGRMRSR
jgi:hypothetical protein